MPSASFTSSSMSKSFRKVRTLGRKGKLRTPWLNTIVKTHKSRGVRQILQPILKFWKFCFLGDHGSVTQKPLCAGYRLESGIPTAFNHSCLVMDSVQEWHQMGVCESNPASNIQKISTQSQQAKNNSKMCCVNNHHEDPWGSFQDIKIRTEQQYPSQPPSCASSYH